VVGFPLGAALPSAKAFEAREAVRCGAREIDMVINIGALKGKDYPLVLKDIAAVVDAAKPYPVKVILETSQLSQQEKIIGSALAKAAGAAFVKTSTGFGGGGATVEDVALMRKVVGEDVGVKASGGIRSTEQALKMIQAGANRIGASASVAIISGQKSGSKY
jgi:deoxyribose-phosphate aldolase